jgi:hypothetical protein
MFLSLTIYKIFKNKHLWSNFFSKKKYEVICIINLKNTLFKGFTRGGPWVPSLAKQNLNRTKKYKAIALKKKRPF